MPVNFYAIVGSISHDETMQLLGVLISVMTIKDIVEVLRAELTDTDKEELGAQFSATLGPYGDAHS